MHADVSASDDIKYKLTKKISYSWLHRYQWYTVGMTYTIRLIVVSTGDVVMQGKFGQRFLAVQ